MDQFLQFIINHWALSAAFIAILLLLLLVEIKSNMGGNRLSPADVTRMINRENAVVVDIRSSDQFSDGHIVNAINIPQADMVDNAANKLKKYQNKPLVLVCNTGQNALLLTKQLTKAGFTRVYVLAGGLQNWRNAGLFLTKNK